MSNIRRLLTQDDKVREVESLQLFFIFVTKYGVALSPATESIESAYKSGDTREKTEE